MLLRQKHIILKVALLIAVLFSFTRIQAQFFNKEIKAVIKVEKNSEFYTFKAVAENLTPADRADLRFEYSIFQTDLNNNTNKNSQENPFVIKGNNVIVLSSLTINYSIEGRVIVALLIYDENDKPIGKDRVVLPNGGRSELQYDNPPEVEISEDQSNINNGFYMEGLVIENAITKAGRDFYRYFTQKKFNLGITTSKNIVISESPARGRTTRIQVTIDQKIVWQFFTQPRKEFLIEQSSIALDRSVRYLQQLQKSRQQLTRY